jgi:hypothetical protein
MITSFDDFCLWMFVLIDDFWRKVAPHMQRPGPKPRCTDSELIAMAVIGEARGWDKETELLSYWREHRDLFHHVPERTRFNRRRRQLMLGINLVRQYVLGVLDLAQDPHCAIDSLPVEIVGFHLAPAVSGEWSAFGARYGIVSSKQETIYGYKLHLVVTLSGVVLNFVLAPANESDMSVGREMLFELHGRTVIGDKAFIDAESKRELAAQRQVEVLTVPRSNQKEQLPPAVARLYNQLRQIIETVNGQLTEQFNIEVNHARSFWGLCARLYTKLAAHSLSIYINRLLGSPHPLRIKALAFPI